MPALGMQWIDGRKLAAAQLQQLQQRVAQYTHHYGRAPRLAVLLVGNNPASALYVRNKQRQAERIGIATHLAHLPADTSEAVLLAHLTAWNADADIDAMLVQLPLPAHITASVVLRHIAPHKDADGLHPYNLGQMLLGAAGPRPCTPLAVMTILTSLSVPLKGLDVAVVGRGLLVGRPLAVLLAAAGATVTVCHRATRGLPLIVKRSPLVVAAAGAPGLVTAEMVQPKAVLIDVGITPCGDRIYGDINPAGMDSLEVQLTPVPGGVGPMTVAMLMENTVWLAEQRQQLQEAY